MVNVIIKYNQSRTQRLVRRSISVFPLMNQPDPWLAYVGCRTTRERNAQGRGLAVFRVDAQGPWQPLQLVEGLRNPSYLCAHPTQPRLYAVHGDFSEISTFAIGPDGLLERIAEQSTRGANPVHLALTPSARWLLVANYAAGAVVTMRVGADGGLGAVAHELRLPGERGPHAQQDASHPHQVCVSPDGRHAFVPDKGLDRVFALAINEDTGVMRIASATPMRPGSGPRHMAFHPGLPLAYVVGELDRTVTVAGVDAASGALTPVAVHSTVPPDVVDGSAGGIVLSPDGTTVFVSNRGHDSVAAFPLGPGGTLGDPGWLAAGRTPRFIGRTPSGRLLVAREDGHSIAALDSGRATFNDVARTGSPVCVVFRKQIP
jgi:6-phosphogluconolactonase